MPFGNRTGPLGQGPMTGRGAGYCAGYGVPGYANPGGFGFGRGRGRGFGRMYYGRGFAPRWGWDVPPYTVASPTKEEELDLLKGQAEALKRSLDDIERRMQELEAKKSD